MTVREMEINAEEVADGSYDRIEYYAWWKLMYKRELNRLKEEENHRVRIIETRRISHLGNTIGEILSAKDVSRPVLTS